MAVAPFVIGFAALFVFLCVAALSKGWSVSIGAMLEYLAQWMADHPIRLRGAPDIHFDFLARGLRRVDHEIRHLLGVAVYATAQPWIVLCRYMGTVFEKPALALADLTADLIHTLAGLRRQVIPAMIAAAVGPLALAIPLLQKQVAALFHRAPVHVLHELTKIVTKASSVVVSKAVAIPFPRIGRLERGAKAQLGRLGRLEALLGIGAITALLLRALPRARLGWLRCSKVGRVGRALCGADESLLGIIAADALVIVSTLSLVEFASAMVSVQEGITATVLHGFRETRGVEPLHFEGYTGTLG